jgi:hypothetical protein
MCEYCMGIFPEQDIYKMSCSLAPAIINYRGKIVGMHKIDKTWTIKQYLQTLRTKMKLSWKGKLLIIYWMNASR